MTSPERIRDALLKRGTKLNSGAATSSTFLDAMAANGITISTTVLSYYNLFDGFDRADLSSQIQVWSLERIHSENSRSYSGKNAGYVSFADVMLDSDFFITDLSDPASPVKLLYEDRVVADSYEGFWSKLASGVFDF